MNLLIVTNLFPTPYDPERGIFTLQLVKRLSKYFNVTVVCPLPWFPNIKFLKNIDKLNKWAQFSHVPDKYVIDNIEIYSPKYLLLPKVSEKIHDSLMALGISNLITKLHKKIKFDVVNSQWLYPDSVAVDKAISKLNLPHVSTGLGCDVNIDIYQKGKRRKILRMLERSQAITVVSNNLKFELIQNDIDDKKITVIPNGIDVDKFKMLDRYDCRNKLNIEHKEPIILYVGRLSEEKSVSTLIDAANNIIKSGTNIHVYIVGDGPLHEELLNKAIGYNIKNNIHFIGKVEHDVVGIWMGATDYFCLPSLREGCPNVILEALGCGIPIIASRVGAIPDIVNKNSGILFKPQDIKELTYAINAALNQDWDPLIISQSVKKLSWEHAAKNYSAVFKSVI